MARNVTKVLGTKTEDVFSYRDDYNDEKLIAFPKWMEMTEQEVEEYLES